MWVTQNVEDCCNRKPDCFDPANDDGYIVAQGLAMTAQSKKAFWQFPKD